MASPCASPACAVIPPWRPRPPRFRLPVPRVQQRRRHQRPRPPRSWTALPQHKDRDDHTQSPDHEAIQPVAGRHLVGIGDIDAPPHPPGYVAAHRVVGEQSDHDPDRAEDQHQVEAALTRCRRNGRKAQGGTKAGKDRADGHHNNDAAKNRGPVQTGSLQRFDRRRRQGVLSGSLHDPAPVLSQGVPRSEKTNWTTTTRPTI